MHGNCEPLNDCPDHCAKEWVRRTAFGTVNRRAVPYYIRPIVVLEQARKLLTWLNTFSRSGSGGWYGSRFINQDHRPDAAFELQRMMI